jgi:hypothetical protein
VDREDRRQHASASASAGHASAASASAGHAEVSSTF